MSDLTNAGENWNADTLLGDLAKDTTLFIGLLSAVADAEAGTVTELSSGNYARAAWVGTTPVNGRIPNSADIDFGTPDADWAPTGTPAVAFGLYPDATGGAPYVVKTLATPKVIQTGDPVKFPAGSLGFTFA